MHKDAAGADSLAKIDTGYQTIGCGDAANRVAIVYGAIRHCCDPEHVWATGREAEGFSASHKHKRGWYRLTGLEKRVLNGQMQSPGAHFRNRVRHLATMPEPSWPSRAQSPGIPSVMKMLVFDDEPSVGRVVVRTAESVGLQATSVVDAAAFAEHVRNESPQVIVLDLQLGATDGVEQLRLLADWNFDGRVVLMSGFDSRVLATAHGLAASLGLNVSSVLEKPLRLADLEQMLAGLRRSEAPLTPALLREAIQNDEMSLCFQPVVTRKTKTLQKLQVLVRWDRPAVGKIAAGEFLPLAETDVATIDALTEWVVGATVEAHQVLAELGVHVPLSVNMSMLNLQDTTLPTRIDQLLRGGNMPAANLHVELTETAPMADPVRARDVMMRLRLKGYVLSLNHFGAGYSPFPLLRQIPFSEVKIDQCLTRDMTTSRECRSIVKSIIDLAGDLKVNCTAGGIDSEELACALEDMGIGGLQGNLICRPKPVEAIPAWMAIWNRTVSAPPEGSEQPTSKQSLRNGAELFGVPTRADKGQTAENSGGEDTAAVYLPPRQLQVMRLLAEGQSVKEIANRLALGIGTVKVHVSLAYSALGARNRVEAIKRAGSLLETPADGISGDGRRRDAVGT